MKRYLFWPLRGRFTSLEAGQLQDKYPYQQTTAGKHGQPKNLEKHPNPFHDWPEVDLFRRLPREELQRMVRLLGILFSIIGLLVFAVLHQLQNQRRAIVRSSSGHRASRTCVPGNGCTNRPLVQAHKNLETGQGGAFPGVGRGAGVEVVRVELELSGLASRAARGWGAGRREQAIGRGGRRARFLDPEIRAVELQAHELVILMKQGQ